MAPTIVTRAQWGARRPKSGIATTSWSNRVGVAVHHSAGAASSSTSAIRAIQNGDMDSDGFSDVGYNWMVTQDGRLWEGRSGGWLAIGAHAGGQNTAWIGVCWIGHSGNVAPSAAALATIRWVVDEARRRAGRRLDVRGHGQVPGQATECPGSRLRVWIGAGLPTEEDDVSAQDVWGYDIENVRDERPKNASTMLRYTNHYAYKNMALARQLQAGQAAILAAVGGLDTDGIVAAINRRAAEDVARDEALMELVEQGQSGELDAAEVVRLIGEKLTAQTEGGA